MPVFLVESYLPGSQNALDDAPASAHRAADQAALDGVAIHYVGTTFVPVDETCLHLFEAPSASAMGTAAARAGLVYDRIVEAVPLNT
jgi:hypothetical protein